jgi:nitrogen fixation NifU-like protein
MDQLDNFTDDLQKKIIADIKKTYSTVVIEHWQRPRNWGIMNDADAYGKITGPCGDTMEISLKIQNNIIMKCTFDTDGCGPSISCGSIVTEMATGKHIDQARKINQKTVLQFCGGLPEESEHCALLASSTLQMALAKWLAKQKNKSD